MPEAGEASVADDLRRSHLRRPGAVRCAVGPAGACGLDDGGSRRRVRCRPGRRPLASRPRQPPNALDHRGAPLRGHPSDLGGRRARQHRRGVDACDPGARHLQRAPAPRFEEDDPPGPDRTEGARVLRRGEDVRLPLRSRRRDEDRQEGAAAPRWLQDGDRAQGGSRHPADRHVVRRGYVAHADRQDVQRGERAREHPIGQGMVASHHQPHPRQREVRRPLDLEPHREPAGSEDRPAPALRKARVRVGRQRGR